MTRGWGALVGLFALIAAGCGGSDGGDGGDAIDDVVASTPDADSSDTDAAGADAADADAADGDGGSAEDGAAAGGTTGSTDADDSATAPPATTSDSSLATSEESARFATATGVRVGPGDLLDLALSPDGTMAVGVGFHRLWMVDIPTMETTLVDLGDQISTSVAFDPAGSTFAFGLSSGAIEVWDAASRQLALELPGAHEEFAALLDYSADGRRLVSTSQEYLRYDAAPIVVHDVATGEVVVEIPNTEVIARALELDGEGGIVAAAADGGVVAWDVETGEQVYENQIVEDSNGELDLEFDDDGSTLYFLDTFDESIWSIDSSTWAEPTLVTDAWTAFGRQLVADGDVLYSQESFGKLARIGTDGSVVGDGEPIEIGDLELFGGDIGGIDVAGDVLVAHMRQNRDLVAFDLASETVLGFRPIGLAEVVDVAFAANGDQVVLHSANGALTWWDVSGDEPAELGRVGRASDVTVDPAGSVTATVPVSPTSYFDFQVVDLTTGSVLVPPDAVDTDLTYVPAVDLAFGHDDESGSIVVVDTNTGSNVATIPTDERPDELALSPDGTQLVEVIDDVLRVWDIGGGTTSFDEGFSRVRRGVEFTDGTAWVLVTDDADVDRLLGIDLASGSTATDVELERTGAFAVSPDASMAAVEGSDTVEIIDLASGAVRAEITDVLETDVLAISPDGTTVALAGESGTALLVPIPES